MRPIRHRRPLHLQRVEIGLVRHVIVGVGLRPDHVAGLEVDKFVRAGADGFQVGRCVARLGAREVGKEMLRNEHAARADESIRPERCRLGEEDADRKVVHLFHLDVFVGSDADGSGRRVR